MYKIFILDVALLNTFLAAADTDYVNAIIGKGNSHLLINQAEVFNVLDLKTITTEPDCHVRIPKVILAKLIRSGSIELRISDGIVEMKLLDEHENCYCTVKFLKQDFPVNDYKFKMEVIRNLSDEAQIDLAQFESLEKLMRTTKSILNVSDGVAMIVATNGRVYKEVSSNYKFAVTQFAYSLLKRCSEIVYNVDNFLIAQKNGLTVIVNKCKSFSNSEYTLFTEQKASIVCGIGLTDLKYFLNKMHSDNSNIKLNLQNRTSHFNLGTISYEVPIEVSDLKGVPNADYTVSIPESIVREVLFSIETKGATLAKKRTFTQIRIKNLLIVF